MSASSVPYKPEGFNTVSQFITVANVERIIDFVKKAFDGQVLHELRASDGSIWHAQVKIGDSIVLFGDTMGMHEGTVSCTYLYVQDVDAMFQKAVGAGGEVVQQPEKQFYGDYSGGVKDPAGNYWFVAQHVEDVSREELERRSREQEEKMKAQSKTKAA